MDGKGRLGLIWWARILDSHLWPIDGRRCTLVCDALSYSRHALWLQISSSINPDKLFGHNAFLGSDCSAPQDLL